MARRARDASSRTCGTTVLTKRPRSRQAPAGAPPPEAHPGFLTDSRIPAPGNEPRKRREGPASPSPDLGQGDLIPSTLSTSAPAGQGTSRRSNPPPGAPNTKSPPSSASAPRSCAAAPPRASTPCWPMTAPSSTSSTPSTSSKARASTSSPAPRTISPP